MNVLEPPVRGGSLCFLAGALVELESVFRCQPVKLLSDYRDGSFGPAYGVLIEDLALLARSVFIIGKDKSILYKQLVPEVGQEPDYDDAIAAASRTSSAVNA